VSKKNERFLSLSDLRKIFYLAIPAMAAMLTQTGINLADTWFIGRLPEPSRNDGQAMLSLALPLFWAVGGFFSAISVGTQAMVSRREGNGDAPAAGAVLTNALVLALGVGSVASVLAWLSMPAVFSFASTNANYVALGSTYAQWRFVGLIAMVVSAVYKAFYDGTSRTYIPFIAAAMMNGVNVLLCWMLMFGNWGAPAWGVEGSGIAAAISSWCGVAFIAAFSLRARDRRTYGPYRFKAIKGSTVGKLARLSFPSGVATAVVMTGFILFRQVVQIFDERYSLSGGTEAIYGAATGIIIEVLSLSFFACLAFGIATATLVSQSLGARDPDAAERYGWSSVKLAVITFSILGGIQMLYPEWCIRLFNQSPEVIRVGTTSMRLMGACSPVVAIGMVLIQALFGAGNTAFVMKVEIILHFGLLLPLAYTLGVLLDFGLMGVWSAAAIYACLLASIMAWKFREGIWKTIDI
jgi:multidrug resistance protein, MATE family